MSELRIESWSMAAADLGPGTPLPSFRAAEELHTVENIPGIPEEMSRGFAYSHPPNILPYTMQDGYTRDRRSKDFRVAVLENEFLRAAFLL